MSDNEAASDNEASSQSGSEYEEAAEVPFALNPAQATGSTLLDFTKKLHQLHHKAAITSLYAEPSDRFDLTQDKLHEFLAKVKRRAQQFSLSTIDVPDNMEDIAGAATNLASGYGEISQAHLKSFAQHFIGRRTRAAQDDYMLYQMLFNSCNEDAQGELADHEDEYTIKGTQCGTLLLHVIMREASVEVSTDPDLIRQELTSAHIKFKELGHDVDALNKWISRKVKQLRASGAQSADLRTHLFKAYRSSPDAAFTRYIGMLKDNIRDNGTELSAKELMSKAKLKMKDLQRERTLDANNDSKDEQILALEAKFNQRFKALEKNNGNGKNNSNGKGKDKGSNKSKGNRRAGKNKQAAKPFPQELKTAGRPDDTTAPKVIDGISYYYCDHHKKWGKHATSKCKAKQAANSSSGGDNNTSNRMARAACAIAAIATGEDE